MRCIQCGAELRPTAQFCSICGAPQALDTERPPEPRESRDTAPIASSTDANETAVAEADHTEAGRIKRRPRVLRASATEGAEQDEEPAPAASGRAEANGAEAATDAVLPRPVIPDDEEDAARGGAASTAEEQVAPPRWDPEGFSWPLPLTIIKGGRYRVEAVVHIAADDETGENVYRVRDLQGYERCWSCGTEYGATNATNTYCNQCGADLLARGYVMYERRLVESEASGEAQASDAVGASGAADLNERTFVEGQRVYRVIPSGEGQVSFPRGVRLLIGVGADVGASRPGEENQDTLGVVTLMLGLNSRMEPATLAAVADGLGGHASGREASTIVVKTLVDFLLRQFALRLTMVTMRDDASPEQLTATLVEGARTANAALVEANTASGEDSGSTLVAALIVGDRAYIASTGDSRVYVLVDGALRRITQDHSLVEQLIIGGMIAPEDRYTHPNRNQIYRSLGDASAIEVDTFTQQLAPGMKLLLCSDGLWEMVRDDELARVLTEAPDPQRACDILIERANAHGGEDNISAIVIEVRA